MARQSKAPHGTETRYVAGCRCDECKAASAAARQVRRKGLGPGKIPPGQQAHGIKGYQHHRCRCDVCRAAHAAHQRRWYARHRSRQAREAAALEEGAS